MAKKIALILFTLIPFLSFGQKHQTVFSNDSLTIVLANADGATKIISQSIRKHPTAKALSIQFKQGEWSVYGFAGDDVAKASNGYVLDALPKNIHILKHLERLYLIGLNLNHFPKELTELENLTILDISFNNLTESEITKLGALTKLKLLKVYGFPDISIVEEIKKYNPSVQVLISADDFRKQ